MVPGMGSALCLVAFPLQEPQLPSAILRAFPGPTVQTDEVLAFVATKGTWSP